MKYFTNLQFHAMIGSFSRKESAVIVTWRHVIPCLFPFLLVYIEKYLHHQLRKIHQTTPRNHSGKNGDSLTHRIHGSGVFTYIDPIKINQMWGNIPVAWMVWVRKFGGAHLLRHFSQSFYCCQCKPVQFWEFQVFFENSSMGNPKKRPQNDWGNETFIKSEFFFLMVT